MTERFETEQRIYAELQGWRMSLYQALDEHRLSYDGVCTLEGDVRQILERIEAELKLAGQREVDRHPHS